MIKTETFCSYEPMQLDKFTNSFLARRPNITRDKLIDIKFTTVVTQYNQMSDTRVLFSAMIIYEEE